MLSSLRELPTCSPTFSAIPSSFKLYNEGAVRYKWTVSLSLLLAARLRETWTAMSDVQVDYKNLGCLFVDQGFVKKQKLL